MLSLLFLALGLACAKAESPPSWDQLDARPLPSWYDDSKFGIFSHWGVYAVPAFRSEWFWWYWQGSSPDPNVLNFIKRNFRPGFTYAEFAQQFTADLFDPDQFAGVVASSGARYFVLTSKHHEGFTMWPSSTSWQWNAKDVGPKRDIVGDLRRAFQKKPNIHFGLYFSLFEWFHPLFISDGRLNRTDFVEQVSWPQSVEIINRYKPDILWSDGDWDKPDWYWRSRDYLNWLYTKSPVKDTIVVNDRWGSGTIGKHGGFLTYSDHYDPGHLLSRKWENCMTLDRESWGYRQTMTSEDVVTAHEVILQLARTIACGGNFLLNVGPDRRGRISPIFEDRLREIGAFVKTNEEAIFGTKPWAYQNDSNNVWYTARRVGVDAGWSSGDNIYVKQQTNPDTVAVYAFLLNFRQQANDVLTLSKPRATKNTAVELLLGNGARKPLSYEPQPGGGITVHTDTVPWRQLPSNDIIVLRITGLAADDHVPLIKDSFDRPARIRHP